MARETVVVRDGTYSVVLTLDNTDLLAGLDLPGESIEVVSPNATICSVVPTGTDFDGEPRQSDGGVREQIGENGEALEGSDDAHRFGSATDNPSVWLEVMTEIEHGSPQQEIEREQASAPRIEPIAGFCLT